MITKPQLIKIKIQLKQLGLDSEEMAYTYSEGRTTHISALHGNEANELVKYLAKALREPESPKERMIRKILSMAHELGWQLPAAAGVKRQVDMARVNRWCLTYGYQKKPLDSYHEYELPTLVTQFENMYMKNFKR